MEYNSNFDVDAVFRVLGTISDKYAEGSQEDEALRIAAVALFYVRETQNLENYRSYFKSFFAPASETVRVSQTFATREEADKWLEQGGAHDGERVKIAGHGFSIVRLPQGFRFLRTPLPEELGPPRSK
jgi:hypothetical protein